MARVFTPRELRSRAGLPPSAFRGRPASRPRHAVSLGKAGRPLLRGPPSPASLLKDAASVAPPRRAERPSPRLSAPAARPLAMLRAPLLPPLLLLLLPPLSGAAAGPAEKRVVQKEAAFERLYGDAVNEKLLNIYAFNHTVSRNRVSRRRPGAAAPGRAFPGLPSAAPRARRSIRAAG